uniref:Uncharacterized protein n=1 Tax=Anguilla anguilla TaxID=7936 RepID=A0A0E9WYF0_ANGAN
MCVSVYIFTKGCFFLANMFSNEYTYFSEKLANACRCW